MNIKETIEELGIKEGKTYNEYQRYTFDLFAFNYNLEIVELRAKFINDMKELSIHEERLFSKQIEELKENDFNAFITEVIGLYSHFSVFPNDKVINRFIELGFSNAVLKWFIPIELILNEMEKLNTSEEIRIEPRKAIELIGMHIFLKIVNSVLLDAKMEGTKRSGGSYNQLHNDIFDLFRREAYNTKVQKGELNEADVAFLNMISHSGLDDNDKDKIQYDALISVQGKTEKNTLGIILNHMIYWTCSERKLYNTVFDFFKLLLPDSSLLSEDEFMSTSHSESYGGNYETYRYIKLKKLLHSSSGKSFI